MIWMDIMNFTFGAGAAVVMALTFVYLGVCLAQSQESAEDIDPRMVLTVYYYGVNNVLRVQTYRIRDQEDAQQKLNEFMFSAIRTAYVQDPIECRMVAKMDKTGRLLGV